MEYLLIYSLEFLLLVPLHPMFWVALVVLGVAAYYAGSDAENNPQSPREHPKAHWLLELALLLIGPFSLLVAGEVFSHTNQIMDPERDRLIFTVLIGLMVVQGIVSVWLIWRHRARIFPTAAVSIAAAAWTVSAYGVAATAATDNWL